MKRICTICIREGSKGVKGKNIKIIAEKPLFLHSVYQALNSHMFDIISISTDSEAVIEILEKEPIEKIFVVKRPEAMATDTAPKIEAIRHCVNEVEKRARIRFDIVIDLDATSPLRNRNDIIEAIRLLESSSASNLITATRARRSPYFNLLEKKNDGSITLSKKPLRKIVRRQDTPPCYDMNASIYGWKRDLLENSDTLFHRDTILYEMPEERSIDIDSPLDFKIVEFLMEHNNELSL